MAHAHLSAGLAATSGTGTRLYRGMIALAFAGHVASQAHGGYRGLLARLDDEISGPVREAARVRVWPVRSTEVYDVIGGLAGAGRYLLARGDTALADVLSFLVAAALAPECTVGGVRVPAWWVRPPGWLEGHVDLGMAHGIGGPLALLSLAWQADHHVPGHEAAIESLVALLGRGRCDDEVGPRWARRMTAAQYRDPTLLPPRSRDVWCNGAAGTAQAVRLAATALNRPALRADADAAAHAAITTAERGNLYDHSLCHGRAGLLHLALGIGDPAADSLAERVLAAFDPATPFGFTSRHPRAARPLDRPGFLEGAAGIALALHEYATARPPRTCWDAALLVR
ncbi:MAG TPA: lanthionine synthetase C family protein [Pseudonocardiaceae bacterium]|nr:lanthionine synthetase C family protein [Pseudonocardiaceae bacterium]